MVSKTKDGTEMIMTCDCWDDDSIILKFGIENLYNGEDFMCYISTASGDFGRDQEGLFTEIGKRIKSAWRMLCGKEYRLKEICMTRASFEEMANMIKEYQEVLNA